MSRQTIFAYLAEEDRAEQVLGAAQTIARRHHSHVIGGYAIPPIRAYPMMGDLPQSVYTGHAEAYQKRAAEIQAQFDAATTGDDYVAEWRLIESGSGTITDALLDHVRCTDLIIAPHYSSKARDNIYADVGEMLAMESGRPVMLLPRHAKTHEIAQHVAVAWDGSRESVRAVFDAIDLLKDAKSVRLISIGEPSQQGSNATLPGAEMAATLSRRGITCEVDNVVPGSLSVGDALLGRIGDMGSDLLVMGIYGHSKLREFVFGGVTRHILTHMTVPVLVSR